MKQTVTTPEQDEIIAKLREGLREWLKASEEQGFAHHLCVTALMLFASSGAVALGVSREAFVSLMGEYHDLYSETRKRDQS